ncbi:hemolysin-III related-domain-containing protein [Cercophora scortea]|uniref:Hemolysin-III related-domain-containing protein n=1 Tax=Cercophora scortea TaxID=314031 RepID=A0AAE0IGJ9_9PEZI|nr:hemolysin-III related-domain-containing protein [Cercophora scortea]
MAAEPTPVRQRQRRPSTSEVLMTTAKQAAAAVYSLAHWDDLETWRRDNHYIHTGYRATSNSYPVSFESVFRLHNETVNIWSHLLGALFFTAAGVLLLLHAVVGPRYGAASPADVRAMACFFAGAFLCLGMSATYHTLSNHSPAVAKWGNKLDYTGIVFLIVGSYVPALYYGFSCFPRLLEVYLSTIAILGLGCLTVSWFEHFRTPAWRPYRALMFVGLGLSGVGPILHGLTIYGYSALNERMGLNWVVLQGALYIFGAFLYGARWPERQFPGCFDIFGSSHQIFHVCVVLAAASHLYGMTKAFDFHHSIIGAYC